MQSNSCIGCRYIHKYYLCLKSEDFTAVRIRNVVCWVVTEVHAFVYQEYTVSSFRAEIIQWLCVPWELNYMHYYY